jgi:nitrate reductase assembly molybdenum cofactor insertion protein NarJ
MLAAALRYPDGDEVREALERLGGFENRSDVELEELYTRTFDISPVCSLEVGWHLYGEDYNRGAFLVRMRSLLRSLGIEEGAELPDHLESALRALGALAESSPEDADALARKFILPAIAKMRDGFPTDTNPYGAVLERTETFLRATHGEPVAWSAPPEKQPYCGGCHGI